MVRGGMLRQLDRLDPDPTAVPLDHVAEGRFAALAGILRMEDLAAKNEDVAASGIGSRTRSRTESPDRQRIWTMSTMLTTGPRSFLRRLLAAARLEQALDRLQRESEAPSGVGGRSRKKSAPFW